MEHWRGGDARTSATSRDRRRAISRSRQSTACRTFAPRWCSTLESLGIKVEAHHHEVATAGQAEIDMQFTTLTRMADNLMLYKYVIKNVARKHGMTATFMPKPLFEDNASGMHVHQSLWKGEHQPVLQRDALRGPQRARAQLHRRPAETRVGAVRPLRSDDKLLPPARSGIRSADQSWSTRSATAPPAVGSRCIRRTRAQNVSSSERQIPPAMATWPSRPC